MAIDPKLLVVKSVNELESVTGLQAGELLFYDGSDNLKKIDIDTFNNLSKTAKPIGINDSAPTVAGLYKPKTSGTYANLQGLIALDGYSTLFFFDGTNWSKTEEKMPEATQSIIRFADSTFPLVAPTPPAPPIQRTHENSIWQLKNGETANVGEVPGSSSKWEKLNSVRSENGFSYKINPNFTEGFSGYAFTGVGTVSVVDEELSWENGASDSSGFICQMNPISGKCVVALKLKVDILGDGILKIEDQFIDLIDDNDYHFYKIYFDFAPNKSSFVFFNGVTNGENQKITVDTIDCLSVDDMSVLEATKKTDSIHIQNSIFGNSLKKNPYFLEGFNGYQFNGVGSQEIFNAKLRWRNGGNPDSGIASHTLSALMGSFKIVARIKVVVFGNGNFRLGNKDIKLINDGEFHNYIVDFKTAENNTFFTIFNTSDVAQEVEIEMLDIYRNEDKTIINAIDKQDVYSLPADINLILNAGQSNSLGADGSISTAIISPNFLRFQGGDFDSATTFEPFRINTGWSEAPTGGVAYALTNLAIKQGFNFSDSNILFGNSGLGGQPIEVLTNDTTAYNRNITIITKGRDFAQAQNKTFAVPIVLWTQGENNYLDSPADYVAKFEILRNKLNADIKSITGQTFNPKWVFYQPSSIYETTGNVMATVLPAYIMMDEIEDCYLVNPQYDKEYMNESGYFVHLKNFSSRKMGAEYGFAINQILTGKNYQCLKIKDISKAGKFINIEFSENVVIDNSNVNTIANHGFTIEGNTIDSITVKDNRATIKCANNVVAGNVLKYAYNGTTTSGNNAGARGNIRANESHFISLEIGVIYKWLPHYQKTF